MRLASTRCGERRSGWTTAMLAVAVATMSAWPGLAETAAPSILSRDAWGARPALPGLRPHRIVGIIVHHTGVRRSDRTPFATKLRNLQRFSQSDEKLQSGKRKPAWPDLPYHFYIDASGTVAEGRDVRYAGDTNTNYNPAGYVQVVLEGNFDFEQPTDAQLRALRQVLRWQAGVQNVTVDRISVHQTHAATACPGKNLAAAMPRLLAALGER